MRLTRKRPAETRGRPSKYLERISTAYKRGFAIECESITESRGVQACARSHGYRTRRRGNIVEIIGKRQK